MPPECGPGPHRGIDVTDSNDSLKKLEEKLLLAVELFKQTQEERRALRTELEKLKADREQRSGRCDRLERELLSLRREREDMRAHIEKILHQLDVLTKPDSRG